MMNIIIVICIIAIIGVATDGLKCLKTNQNRSGKLKKFDSSKSKNEGTLLSQSHTLLPWLFKPRHK